MYFCRSYIFFNLQYELLKDHKALNTVRELLVIIRIWGLLRPSCLPVFLRSTDNLDVLALLFCLLSKLVQPNGDPQQQQQVDDGLIGMFANFLKFYIFLSSICFHYARYLFTVIQNVLFHCIKKNKIDIFWHNLK